jgi:hypothetical protein
MILFVVIFDFAADRVQVVNTASLDIVEWLTA